MNNEQICKKVSQELNINYDVVKKIFDYQFTFIREVMQDEEDTHDILLNKLFKFKLKNKFKENK